MRMSHNEERAGGNRFQAERERTPRHWLNPRVGRSKVESVFALFENGLGFISNNIVPPIRGTNPIAETNPMLNSQEVVDSPEN